MLEKLPYENHEQPVLNLSKMTEDELEKLLIKNPELAEALMHYIGLNEQTHQTKLAHYLKPMLPDAIPIATLQFCLKQTETIKQKHLTKKEWQQQIKNILLEYGIFCQEKNNILIIKNKNNRFVSLDLIYCSSSDVIKNADKIVSRSTMATGKYVAIVYFPHPLTAEMLRTRAKRFPSKATEIFFASQNKSLLKTVVRTALKELAVETVEKGKQELRLF